MAEPVVTVDPKAVACSGFLGFGAEWDPFFWAEFNRKAGVTEADWQTVVRRIRFMRLPVVRMMMLARWCVAGPGRFDWQTAEMKCLYRYLDVCQQEGITVLLTDWGCQTWTKGPFIKGHADPFYAEAIGTYLEHLVRRKGYTCIRCFILVNEPNFEGGGWDNWKAGVRNVAAELKKRRLDGQITFAGADPSNDDDWHRRAVDQLADVFGAWDVHRYANDADVRPGRLEDYFAGLWRYAREHDPKIAAKKLIVGEAGMNDGAMHPHGNRNIGSFGYGLFMADYAVQATRAGSHAVLAWMLDDSSHQGFTWGLWADKTGGLALRPWFGVWSLLCRCVPPGSTLYRIDSPRGDARILAARCEKPAGWTFVLVNRGTEPLALRLRAPEAGTVELARYLYVQKGRKTDADGFPQPVDTQKADLAAGHPAGCPAESVVLLTSIR